MSRFVTLREDVEIIKVKNFQKHQQHDQSSHGNWAGTKSPDNAISAERARQVASYKDVGLTLENLFTIFKEGDAEGFNGEIGGTFDFTTSSGYQFTQSSFPPSVFDGNLEVNGEVTNPNGLTVGTFKRSIEYNKNTGQFSAYHGILELKKSAQGKGVGSEYFRHTENYYRSKGFEKIQLLASLQTGPYAWAKQGFEFDDVRADREGVDQRENYKRHLEDFKTKNTLSEPAVAKINNLQNRMTSTDKNIRSSVQPIDIANLYDGDRHIGKEIMTSPASSVQNPPGYYAVKYLTADGMPSS